ncbi:MAG: putative transcriptional regulator [candidate division CPR2 bacterium GW2011_GWC1_39_9]|nr:MAG: putative transcriptional regulator [candidate division CPR2 bacterium GW2011_GWC1_39_9]
MLEQLFGSKTRVKLLSMFFNNSQRSFYVREITRKIDEQINSVRRELANLQDLGIVVSLAKNGKLYYCLDNKYEFAREFKSIFKVADVPQKEDNEEKLAVKFKRTGVMEMVLMMGYFVGDHESQIDLFIVGNADKKKLKHLVDELQKDAGKELNFCIMTKDEYQYRNTLYDRFIMDVMSHPKITLINKIQNNLGALHE